MNIRKWSDANSAYPELASTKKFLEKYYEETLNRNIPKEILGFDNNNFGGVNGSEEVLLVRSSDLYGIDFRIYNKTNIIGKEITHIGLTGIIFVDDGYLDTDLQPEETWIYLHEFVDASLVDMREAKKMIDKSIYAKKERCEARTKHLVKEYGG